LIGPHGAQAASLRPRFGRIAWIATVTALVTTLGAAPTAGASTSSVSSGQTSVALTVTSIDRPWYSVEQFYLGLVNCTRTGGWVLSDGTCRGYGSGRYSAYVRPLTLSSYISDRVARPYAKLLAVKGICSHYANGDPGYRFRRVGLTHWTWAENIGCRDGYASAKTAVLTSHLNFQAEKATNGGHWRNIKNATYTLIGIGVWRYGSRTRLVTDFYR
jgi:hypothetical protein